MPPAHAVPSGSFFLHLPCLRFLQGGHGFFFFAVVCSAPELRTPRAPDNSPPRARRREPVVVRVRVSLSKRVPSIRACLSARGQPRCARTVARKPPPDYPYYWGYEPDTTGQSPCPVSAPGRAPLSGGETVSHRSP